MLFFCRWLGILTQIHFKFKVVCGHFITFSIAATALPCQHLCLLSKKLKSSKYLHPLWDSVLLVHKKLTLKKQNKKTPWFYEPAPMGRGGIRICFLKWPVISNKLPFVSSNCSNFVMTIPHTSSPCDLLVAFQHHRISGLSICSTLCMTTFKPPIILVSRLLFLLVITVSREDIYPAVPVRLMVTWRLGDERHSADIWAYTSYRVDTWRTPPVGFMHAAFLLTDVIILQLHPFCKWPQTKQPTSVNYIRKLLWFSCMNEERIQYITVGADSNLLSLTRTCDVDI